MNIYNKFKSLFDSSATIDDDFNVFYQYDPKKKSGSYSVKLNDKRKTFDVYAHDVALQIKGINITTDTIISNPAATNQQNMTFTIERTVQVQKTRQYVLPDNVADEVMNSRTIEFEEKEDSLAMASNLKKKINENRDAVYKFTSKNTIRITMKDELDTIKITSIESIKNDIKADNDDDYDAVLNEEDSAANKFGDFTAFGRPDSDLDGVPDGPDKCKSTYGQPKNKGCPFSYFFTKNEFDGFIGLQFNSVPINLPEKNELGYLDASGQDAMDVLQSYKGTLTKPGMLAGVHAGGNIIFYFGQKRKKSGISIGFTYSGLTAEYRLTDSIVYTFKASDGINFYRRQIKIRSLKEGINYNIFNFPVMFNYRWHMDKKNRAVINVQAGPSFMLFLNKSDYNATIDFGGLYQIDINTKNKITYYDQYDITSPYNIKFTSAAINSQSQNPGADKIFEQLASKNYDFASNKNYSGKQNLNRMTVAFNLEFDLQYKVSEGLTIKAGPHITYAPLFKGKEKYKPIDRTNEEFQSIYKGNATSAYSAYGMNVGFVYNF